MKQILKVIVGSQAHGLANKDSDFDYRGVFVVPTSEILSLGGHKKNTLWIEGKNDDTSWELGHFLHLATHCNPTIMEVFLAPMASEVLPLPDEVGVKLRELFPHVWNSKGVRDAFRGYGLNQRKKFFDNKDNRASKYAVAYLRTLFQGTELLESGTFPINMIDTPIGKTLKKWKALDSVGIHKIAGEVIEICLLWEKRLNKAYEENPDKQTEIEPINEFLLQTRKDFW